MDLNLYVAFQAVADTRSFTQAAAKLGMDKSHLSRLIRQLEQSLGTPLFTRTTRAVHLTPEGEQLRAEVTSPLGALTATAQRWKDQTTAPTGRVSLGATPDLAHTVLAPLLATFRTRYPAVTVRVVLSYDLTHLESEQLDLALRVGKVAPGAFVTKKLGELRAAFFAAPAYLALCGTPESVADLANHQGLWPDSAPGKKSFSPRQSNLSFREPGIACADFEFLLAVARAGGGVALLPTHLAQEDLEQGRLLRVLPEVSLGEAPLYLVSRATRPVPGRIAVLKAHLQEGLSLRFSAGARSGTRKV